MKLATCIFYFFLILNLTYCGRTKYNENIPKSLKNITVFSKNADPQYGITLTKDATYGDTSGVFLGRFIKDIAVDDRERVYVADFFERKIHVYTPAGSYIQSIGREGKGPGEFQFIWVLRVKNQQLFVLDYIQSHISVFDLNTLAHIQDIAVSLDKKSNNQPSWANRIHKKGLTYRPVNFYVRPDGNFLVFFGDEDIGSAYNIKGRTYEGSIFSPKLNKYLEHDVISFKWTGKVHVYKGGRMINNVPYKLSSQFDSFGNELVYGWTKELLFKVYNNDGSYQRAFYYSRENSKLKRKDVLKYYKNDKQVRNVIRNVTLPETWPAFKKLKLDDENQLWVSVIVDDMEVYQWWVLKDSGELLAQFMWPKNRQIEVVKNGKLYARTTDEETGLQQILRYRIEMN